MDTKRIREVIESSPQFNGPEVVCKVCGFSGPTILQHLLNNHCGTRLEDYVERFPSAPLATAEGRKQITALLDKIERGQRSYKIKDTFGCDICTTGTVKTAMGRIKPCKATPALLPYYKFRPDLLKVVLFALEEPRQNLYLYGPSGGGKTSVVEQVCARLNRGVVRVNHDSDIGRAEIVGQWVLTGKDSMSFAEGLLPIAMRSGYVYIADEFDVVDPAIAMLYQAVLEGKPLTILETAEVIEPHPEFRFIATGNTAGAGDLTGLHHGTRPMNEATMQRFTLFECVDYPTAVEECDILEGVCGMNDPTLRQKMVEVGNLIRKAYKEDKISVTFSTRILINVADKLLAFGSLRRAYELALLNRLNAVDAKTVEEAINAVWGSEANA